MTIQIGDHVSDLTFLRPDGNAVCLSDFPGPLLLVRRGVLARYLRLIFTGWRPHSGEAGEDMLQLGGDFILSVDRRLVYAHRSKDPADRPAASDLVKQIQQLAVRNGSAAMTESAQ